MRRLLAIALAALALAACDGFGRLEVEPPPPGLPEADRGIAAAEPDVLAAFDAPEGGLALLGPAAAQAYLAQLAPMLAGRELRGDELGRLEAEGGRAIRPLLVAWAGEPGFAEAARQLVSNRLATSGQKDGIDFDLPGNLAAQLARTDAPWSRILTEPGCYDRAGNAIACDTGAPYAAGVLTTRAYQVSRLGRFNLTRASSLLRTFACRGYPMEDGLQPYIDRSRLIAMFRATSAADQEDERASGGFGNGHACYTCHGQFSLHAQLFVRFDASGTWRADATGLQDPAGELGRSHGGLMASHLEDPAEAASEASQLFGREVANLAEAAAVLASSDAFRSCAARRLLEHALALDDSVVVDPDLLHAIATRAGGDPSLGALMVETFSDPIVVESVLAGIGGEP